MITAQQVEDIVKTLPWDRSNPSLDAEFGQGGCIYTSPSDPNDHCIAGEILVRLGYSVPAAGDEDNSETIGNLLVSRIINIEYSAADKLARLQSVADAATQDGWQNAWGKAIQDVYPSLQEPA